MNLSFARRALTITTMTFVASIGSRGTWRLAALALPLLALAACERMSSLGFDTQSAFGSVSLADRCTDLMHRAYPNAELDVTNSHVSVEGNAATVLVAATRNGVSAKSGYAREIGVECRFESNILTGFRWTAGPIRPTGVGQARQ